MAETARNVFFFLAFFFLLTIPLHAAAESLAHPSHVHLFPTHLGGYFVASHAMWNNRNNNGEEMEEREFFDERPEKKPATLNCPHCHQSGDYEVTWLVRTKKKQLPRHADERDRARFAKAKSYMLRKDDVMGCKNVRCRKRFEISGLQSVVFTD